jgi:hypothetical protein
MRDEFRLAANGCAAMSTARSARMPVAVEIGASVLALLLAAALAAAFAVAHWDARDRADRAEADLGMRLAHGVAAVGDLLEDRLGFLTLAASLSPADATMREPAGNPRPASVPATTGRVTTPSVGWVDGRGRVVVASTALRAGEDVSSRPWFTTAVGGPLLSEEFDAAPAAAAASQPQVAREWAVQAVVPVRWSRRSIAPRGPGSSNASRCRTPPSRACAGRSWAATAAFAAAPPTSRRKRRERRSPARRWV